MPSSILNSDDGVISGTSGLKSSGGDDGVLNIQNNGTTAISVASDGDVGIGTTSPSGKLHVTSSSFNPAYLETSAAGSDNVQLRFKGTTGERWAIGNNIAAGGAGLNFDIYDLANNANRMRIDSSGNLLVGTTSVVSDSKGIFSFASQTSGGEAGGLYVRNTASSNGDVSPPLVISKTMGTTTSSARFVQFYASNTQAMGGIVGNGVENVQFATISDVREKTNIQTISGSLDKIAALNPVSFDWIKNGEHCPAGFVAQDVEQVFPEFVIENFSQEGQEPRKGLTGGMTGGIIPHLVKAIQELSAKNDALEARIAALEAVPGNE